MQKKKNWHLIRKLKFKNIYIYYMQKYAVFGEMCVKQENIQMYLQIEIFISFYFE